MQHPSSHRRHGLVRRIHQQEEGFALGAALFIGLALVIISSVLVTRAMTQSDLTVNNVEWENALQTAESGIDVALDELNKDLDFATVPETTPLLNRDQIVAAADALALADDKNIVEVGGGQAVIVRAVGSSTIFGVGYVPSWDDPGRNIRVVEAAYTPPRWKPDLAILVGGDIKLEAKKGDKDIEVTGGMHVNGNVQLKQKHEENVNGCLTADSLTEKSPKPGDPPTVTPYVHEDCPAGTSPDPVPVPEIDSMVLHKYSQYDICWDKTGAYYGPNWQQSDPGAPRYLAPPLVKGTEGDPCSGSLVAGDLGIEKGLDKTDDKIEFKDKKNDIEGPKEGVYFLEGRSAKLRIEDDQVLNMTLITSKPNGDLTCKGEKDYVPEIDKDNYGDVEVEIKSNSRWRPHEHGDPYVVVTGGDLKIKMKGKPKKSDQGSLEGVVAVHEQVKLEANDATAGEGDEPKGGIFGAIIAEQACDTKDSKLKEGKSEFKKGDMILDTSLPMTDFGLKGSKDKLALSYVLEMSD